MDFLKDVLGEELFAKVTAAVDAYNGDETHKDRQVKLANLAGGEYVAKGKYDALSATLTGKQGELDTANGLIAELKKGTKGNEELQGKIAGYEAQVADLQKQLRETKIRSAVKVALLSENVADVDYVMFKLNEKLKEKGEALEVDEDDNIKGWADRLASLKTQLPQQFASSGAKIYEEHKLTNSEGQTNFTKEEILKKPYSERVKLYQENPDAYNEIMEK